MEELKMMGNCLKGSRPLISFDTTFDKQPHTSLLKQMFSQVCCIWVKQVLFLIWLQAISTPKWTVKSKPFIDHMFSFFYQDNKIWFRNFQVSQLTIAKTNKEPYIISGCRARGGQEKGVSVERSWPTFRIDSCQHFIWQFHWFCSLRKSQIWKSSISMYLIRC